MTEAFKMIIEQAKENGTYEQLMSVVRGYEQTHTAGIPNSFILSKDQERILRAQLEDESKNDK
ncbi:MAG: hypothetical protein IJJ56_04955 [Prevotella sp.]|nr:hypothetical protein [Prevotella sp.]